MRSLTDTYGVNPVPWVTDLWSGAFAQDDPVKRDSAALAVLSSVANGLSDDDRTYSVRFSSDGMSTATSLRDKVVTIGRAPMMDTTLTDGQRAAIMSGLVFHEVGHIRHTRKVVVVLDSYGVPGDRRRAQAQRVLNLVDDVRADRLQQADYPGLSETLPVTLRWIGDRTHPVALRATKISSPFGMAIMAIRYPDHTDWAGCEAARDWWQSWAERSAVAHTIPALRAVIDEALDRIDSREDMPLKPEPEPEPIEDGQDDDDGDPIDEPGDEPTTEGGDTPSSDPGDDTTEGGEQPDDPFEDGDDVTEGDEPDEDGDEPGDDTTDGGDEPGEPTDDVTDGDDGDEPGEPTDTDTTEGGEKAGETPTDGDDVTEGDEDLIDVEANEPECPMARSQDGSEATAQQWVDMALRGKRERDGVRTYDVPDRWGGGTTTYTVTRAVPARRGNRPSDPTTMAFLPPTVGVKMEAQYSSTQRPIRRMGVSQALASALTTAKRGDPTPTPGQRNGRIDRQRLARTAAGDFRVFTNVVLPGPRRIRAIVLLDASGSMSYGLDPVLYPGLRRSTVAAQLGMDLAVAFERLPNVTAAVYAHNENRGITIHALWQTGEPTDYVGDYADLKLDENSDAMAIRYCTDDMTESRKPGESCVIVVVSDGAPVDTADVKSAVDAARKRNVAVVSVALAAGLIEDQHKMYGHEDVVPFGPSPVVLARKIAQAIGRRV